MSEWKTKPPCKDCPEHIFGCKHGCSQWEKYQDDLEAEKKQKEEFERLDNMHKVYHREKWSAADKKKMMRRK